MPAEGTGEIDGMDVSGGQPTCIVAIDQAPVHVSPVPQAVQPGVIPETREVGGHSLVYTTRHEYFL
jgi:hypothetical protein